MPDAPETSGGDPDEASALLRFLLVLALCVGLGAALGMLLGRSRAASIPLPEAPGTCWLGPDGALVPLPTHDAPESALTLPSSALARAGGRAARVTARGRLRFVVRGPDASNASYLLTFVGAAPGRAPARHTALVPRVDGVADDAVLVSVLAPPGSGHYLLVQRPGGRQGPGRVTLIDCVLEAANHR